MLAREKSEVAFNFMFEFINRAASMTAPVGSRDDGIQQGMGPRGRWLAQPARRNDLGNHSAEQNYHTNSDRLIVPDRVTWAPSKFAFRNPRPAAVKIRKPYAEGVLQGRPKIFHAQRS